MKQSIFILSLLLAFFTAIGVADEIHLVLFNSNGAPEATGAGNAIEVASYSLGDPSAGSTGVDKFSIHKQAAGKAPLFGLGVGIKYAEAALTIQRTSKGPAGKSTLYLTYTFTEVSIESISWTDSGDEDSFLDELITFGFAKVASSVTDTPPQGSGGVIGGAWTVTTANEQ